MWQWLVLCIYLYKNKCYNKNEKKKRNPPNRCVCPVIIIFKSCFPAGKLIKLCLTFYGVIHIIVLLPVRNNNSHSLCVL